MRIEADDEDIFMIHTLEWSITFLFFLQGFLTIRGANQTIATQKILRNADSSSG